MALENWLLMAPAGDDGADGGGGADDRGDDHLDDDTQVADDKDDKGGQPRDSDGKFIPKSRFDEALGKERDRAARAEAAARAAEARLAELDKSALDPEKVEAEIAGLEEQLDKAVVDGDKAKVAALRKEIRTKVQNMASTVAEEKAARAAFMAIERVRYDATVKELEAQFPVMNPDSEEYDQGQVDELLELKAAYEATGMGSSDALRKATKYVMKAAESAKPDKKDDDAGESAADRKAAAEAAAKRKEAAIAEAAKARARQPADQTKAGRRSDTSGASGTAQDLTKMSDKDFSMLAEKDPEALARARGDDI